MTNGLWTYTDIYQSEMSLRRIGVTSKLLWVKAHLDILHRAWQVPLVSVMPWQPEMKRYEVAASTNCLALGLDIQYLDNAPENNLTSYLCQDFIF